MPGRSNRSARVVICDDVSWSEPATRGRRTAAELDPPSWAVGAEQDGVARGDAFDRPDPVGRRAEPGWGEDLVWGDERPRRGRPASAASAAPATSTSPASRRRRAGDLDERHAARAQRAREASGHRVEDYLDGDGWLDALPAPAPVIDYTDAVDEERIWGPRPKLQASEAGGRRTVVITGRGSDRYVEPRSSGHGALPMQLRYGFAADRTAMWAVLLCVIVLLVALGSH